MLVYQTKYRSRSTQFKLFISAYVLTYFCEFCQCWLWFLFRYPNIFWRIYGGKNSTADSASRIFFGWYSADKNSAANLDIQRRLGCLLQKQYTLIGKKQRVKLNGKFSVCTDVLHGIPHGWGHM